MYISTNSITFAGLFLGFVLFVCSISPGESVHCYECSSVNDTRCMDPFDKVAEFIVNCSKEYPEAKFCRKIDQTVKGEHRVFRRCAWEEHKTRECYYGANEYYRAKICICSENECNGATTVHLITTFVLVLASSVGSALIRQCWFI